MTAQAIQTALYSALIPVLDPIKRIRGELAWGITVFQTTPTDYGNEHRAKISLQSIKDEMLDIPITDDIKAIFGERVQGLYDKNIAKGMPAIGTVQFNARIDQSFVIIMEERDGVVEVVDAYSNDGVFGGGKLYKVQPTEFSIGSIQPSEFRAESARGYLVEPASHALGEIIRENISIDRLKKIKINHEVFTVNPSDESVFIQITGKLKHIVDQFATTQSILDNITRREVTKKRGQSEGALGLEEVEKALIESLPDMTRHGDIPDLQNLHMALSHIRNQNVRRALASNLPKVNLLVSESAKTVATRVFFYTDSLNTTPIAELQDAHIAYVRGLKVLIDEIVSDLTQLRKSYMALIH